MFSLVNILKQSDTGIIHVHENYQKMVYTFGNCDLMLTVEYGLNDCNRYTCNLHVALSKITKFKSLWLLLFETRLIFID